MNVKRFDQLVETTARLALTVAVMMVGQFELAWYGWPGTALVVVLLYVIWRGHFSGQSQGSSG